MAHYHQYQEHQFPKKKLDENKNKKHKLKYFLQGLTYLLSTDKLKNG